MATKVGNGMFTSLIMGKSDEHSISPGTWELGCLFFGRRGWLSSHNKECFQKLG